MRRMSKVTAPGHNPEAPLPRKTCEERPRRVLKGASMEQVRAQSGMVTEQIAVSTSAGLLIAADTSAGPNARGFVSVCNTHATNILYLGPTSGVTTGNGYPVNPGKEVILAGAKMYNGAVYAIGSGALTAAVLRY